jgi:hypothetical protein
MVATAREVHGWRRGMRWVKRIALALVALVVLGIAGVFAFLHTDYGREQVRSIGNDQLNSLFTGGGTIGKVDGSPFGDLILRDVVINGPDNKPAITVKELRVRVGLVNLVKHDIVLRDIAAEDVDVAIKRNPDGSFEMANLLKPSEPTDKPETKSAWNIDLSDVDVVRAHLMIDTGTQDVGVVDLDDVVIHANAHLDRDGTKSGALRIAATWRQKTAPVSIVATARDDAETAQAKHLEVSVGGVSIAASDLHYIKASHHFTGKLVVAAPKAAVDNLLPRLQLPGDVGLTVEASTAHGAMIPIALNGHVGTASLTADLQADLDALHATGKLSTSELDLAMLTRGKIVATGALAATFDVAKGAAGELPRATANITAHGTYETIPRVDLTAELTTGGQSLSAKLDTSGPVKAKIAAALTRMGDGFHLDRSSIVASVADPEAASGGKAPVHGMIEVSATASGALSPPDLAVKATVNGQHVKIQDLSIATLAVSIDGTHLPSQPHGTANVKLTDIIKGEIQLGMLVLDARDRSDGKIAVNLTSTPKQDPWLIELAALVTPPGRGDTITVDLGKHRVRAGNRSEWTGDGGKIVVDPREFSLANFSTKSGDGSIAASGSMDRKTGDIAAKLDVDKLALAVLGPRYLGQVSVHADVKKAATLSGTVDITGTGIALDEPGLPRRGSATEWQRGVVDKTHPPVDLAVKLVAKPRSVTVDAKASSPKLGAATVDLDLVAPSDVTDVVAWRRAGRDAIRTAKIAVSNVDLNQVAIVLAQPVDRIVLVPDNMKVLGHLYAYTRPKDATPVTVLKPQMAGRLDGEFTLTPTTAKGDFKIQKLEIPQVRGLGQVTAELAIDSPTPKQIVPTITISAPQIGTVTTRAELAMPNNIFDANEWQKLGIKALHTATLRTTVISFDPAMLQRFGIQSSLRGRARVSVDLGEGLSTVKVVGDVADLRGSPIAQPVGAHLELNLVGKTTTAKLVMTTGGGRTTLLTVDAKVPLTIDELRVNPGALATAPLEGTIEMKQTSAPALLAAFGRNEVTKGTLDAKVVLTGTIVQPKLVAHIAAQDLQSTPSALNQPTPVLKQLTLDATYDGNKATLKLLGDEGNGGTLDVEANLDPRELKAGTAMIKAKAFDMKPLLAFAPDPGNGAKGILDANLTVKGLDPTTAQITGELHLKNARMPIAPNVGTMRDGTVDVKIDDKQIVLAATGKLGHGDLKLDGTIELAGTNLSGGQAVLTLHKVSPIGAVEPEINAVITTKMSRQNEVWTADVVIDKGFVKIGKSGEALKPVGMPSDMRLGGPKKQAPALSKDGPNAPPPPAKPALIAKVTLKPVKVEASEFRTTVNGTLDVTVGETMGVKGTIEASSGDLDLFDRRYRIERAAVMFDGTVDPNLEVRIVHDFSDVTTITEVRGRLSKPDLVLTSDPGLYSQTELLGFLLGGEPGGDPTSGTASDKAAALGSSIIANQIGGYVKKALPIDIDVIRYESATATSSAAITVGTWITHTLFFSVSQHLETRADENTDEGTLEYWFTRRLELELTAGDRNYDGVDLLWRKRY